MTLRTFLSTSLLLAVAYFGFIPNAHALTVSPARIEIAGDPGTTVGGEIVLYNEQDEQKTFYLSSENFEAQGETGAPNFVPAKEGLATWIDAEHTVVLNPGATETIPFNITIPSNARAGGHFAAIFWGTNPPSDSGQVSVGARVGVLILLRVSGDISEKGGITEFGIENNKKFFTTKETTFTYRFQNAGDDRLLPEGVIKITNIFGAKVAELNANESMGNILPLSTRKFTANWNGGTAQDEKFNFKNQFKDQWKHFGFGWYKATVDVSYGTSDTKEQSTTHFFVFSWIVTITILLALLIIIFGGRLALRKYNHWVIAQAQRYMTQNKKSAHDETTDTDK